MAQVASRLGVTTHSLYQDRAIEDKRLLGHMRHAWIESGSVYGYRKVMEDLRDLGETCSERRIYRMMRQEKLRS